jgi:hypothetical protein
MDFKGKDHEFYIVVLQFTLADFEGAYFFVTIKKTCEEFDALLTV